VEGSYYLGEGSGGEGPKKRRQILDAQIVFKMVNAS
jgi:hypothetical protein